MMRRGRNWTVISAVMAMLITPLVACQASSAGSDTGPAYLDGSILESQTVRAGAIVVRLERIEYDSGLARRSGTGPMIIMSPSTRVFFTVTNGEAHVVHLFPSPKIGQAPGPPPLPLAVLEDDQGRQYRVTGRGGSRSAGDPPIGSIAAGATTDVHLTFGGVAADVQALTLIWKDIRLGNGERRMIVMPIPVPPARAVEATPTNN